MYSTSFYTYDYMQEYITRFVSISLLVLLSLYAIVAIIRSCRHNKLIRKLTEYVQKNSVALIKLSTLNQQFEFHNINSEYVFVKTYSSKNSFNFANIEKYTLEVIESEIDFFKTQIQLANKNKTLYENYCCKIVPLLTMFSAKNWTDFSNKNRSLCEEIEGKLFRDLIQTPTTQIKICIIKEYTSPMGQNHYEEEFTYSQSDILRFIEQVEEIEKRRETSQYQRSLLTPSMRYDIMKRDNFKCVLCGASTSEGASLEVDHIIPIARGGKTEPSNLRTLCHDCNAGKSAKYDADGIN